jgi:hypothetical protein
MSNGIHVVVLYIHEPLKRFSITARMERARLPGVDQQMADQGYTRKVLGEGLDKTKAEELRAKSRAKYQSSGYTYQTRPQLS